jgi:hypothetical protein
LHAAERALLESNPGEAKYMDAELDQALAIGRLRALGETPGSSAAAH